MKIVAPILGLIALLGVLYGLAFFGIIPAQKLADKSPALAAKLIALHLAKPKKPKMAVVAATATVSPEQMALDAQKTQIAAAQAQLAKDRADFEAEKQAPAPSTAPDSSAAGTVAGTAAVADSAAKLHAIYGAMSADDMATIFAKLPDPDVISALMSLDEKKAGKVLAALPTDRAARLTLRMAHVPPPSIALATPSPSPHMSL